MSTPQGPNGADRGQPGRKPEDRTEHEVKPESSGQPQGTGAQQQPAPQNPSAQNPSPQTSSAQAQVSQPQGQSGPAAGAPQDQRGGEPAAKPATSPSSAGQPAQDRPAAEPASKAAPVKPAQGDSGKPGASGAGPAADGNSGRTAPAEKPSADAGQSGQMPRAGGQTPPWQRGTAGGQQSGMPQNAPQTNVPGVGPGLSKPGAAAAAQRPGGASAAGKGGSTGGTNPSTRPVVTGTAAPGAGAGARAAAERAAAAKAKSAVIDGPTRHIERKDLAKDLPDLSAVKHPSPSAPTTGETPQVAAPVTAAPTVIAPTGPLRATVQIRRIDPWSMLKVSSVISVSLFFVWMIAVGLLYGVLAGMGVWERLNSAFTDIVSDAGSGALISAGQVFGYATIIGVANTVLLTALATLGAFIYNLCTDLVGGVQATLADPD